MDVVDLRELWSLTFSTLYGRGGLERTDFNHSLFCVDVVVLKELIFNIIYFVWMWWSWEELIFNILYFVWMQWSSRELWFLTFCNLCGCGCLERTDFKQFLLYGDVVVLREVIFNMVCILCGSGGLEKTDFYHFLLCVDVVVLKKVIFNHYLLCVDVVVSKEVIFNIFYFVWMWWSWKNWF